MLKYKRLVPICLIALLSVFSSCTNGGRIKVKGSLLNASNKMIFLKELTINEVVPIDSMKIGEDGDFVLKAKNSKAAFYALSLSKEQTITLILLPGDKVIINGDALKLEETYTVEGSEASLKAKELNDQLRETLAKVDNLRKIYQDSIGSKNILKVRANLDSLYSTIEKEHVNYTTAFIRNNIRSLASLMALYQQLGPRKPVLNPKDHYEFFAMVDSSMMLTYPESDAVQSLHTLMDEVKEQHNRQTETEKRTAIGSQAPEIMLKSYKGDSAILSRLKGKYVLLGFWASWSNASRQENLNLVKSYWRYKNAGFDVFQVSLDKNHDAWVNAIASDKLPWINTSDYLMWNSPVIALYGIESIPANYLLDKDGIIIAKNLKTEDLNKKLLEIFKY